MFAYKSNNIMGIERQTFIHSESFFQNQLHYQYRTYLMIKAIFFKLRAIILQ